MKMSKKNAGRNTNASNGSCTSSSTSQDPADGDENVAQAGRAEGACLQVVQEQVQKASKNFLYFRPGKGWRIEAKRAQKMRSTDSSSCSAENNGERVDGVAAAAAATGAAANCVESPCATFSSCPSGTTTSSTTFRQENDQDRDVELESALSSAVTSYTLSTSLATRMRVGTLAFGSKVRAGVVGCWEEWKRMHQTAVSVAVKNTFYEFKDPNHTGPPFGADVAFDGHSLHISQYMRTRAGAAGIVQVHDTQNNSCTTAAGGHAQHPPPSSEQQPSMPRSKSLPLQVMLELGREREDEKGNKKMKKNSKLSRGFLESFWEKQEHAAFSQYVLRQQSGYALSAVLLTGRKIFHRLPPPHLAYRKSTGFKSWIQTNIPLVKFAARVMQLPDLFDTLWLCGYQPKFLHSVTPDTLLNAGRSWSNSCKQMLQLLQLQRSGGGGGGQSLGCTSTDRTANKAGETTSPTGNTRTSRATSTTGSTTSTSLSTGDEGLVYDSTASLGVAEVEQGRRKEEVDVDDFSECLTTTSRSTTATSKAATSSRPSGCSTTEPAQSSGTIPVLNMVQVQLSRLDPAAEIAKLDQRMRMQGLDKMNREFWWEEDAQLFTTLLQWNDVREYDQEVELLSEEEAQDRDFLEQKYKNLSCRSCNHVGKHKQGKMKLQQEALSQVQERKVDANKDMISGEAATLKKDYDLRGSKTKTNPRRGGRGGPPKADHGRSSNYYGPKKRLDGSSDGGSRCGGRGRGINAEMKHEGEGAQLAHDQNDGTGWQERRETRRGPGLPLPDDLHQEANNTRPALHDQPQMMKKVQTSDKDNQFVVVEHQENNLLKSRSCSTVGSTTENSSFASSCCTTPPSIDVHERRSHEETTSDADDTVAGAGSIPVEDSYTACPRPSRRGPARPQSICKDADPAPADRRAVLRGVITCPDETAAYRLLHNCPNYGRVSFVLRKVAVGIDQLWHCYNKLKEHGCLPNTHGLNLNFENQVEDPFPEHCFDQGIFKLAAQIEYEETRKLLSMSSTAATQVEGGHHENYDNYRANVALSQLPVYLDELGIVYYVIGSQIYVPSPWKGGLAKIGFAI
ncbi:unnamed protein product [Amoebophrya sp. A120]|nr:unnamed protein product [Amoebophrya sp. A120]|eukprot:GSA120T00016413001.1